MIRAVHMHDAGIGCAGAVTAPQSTHITDDAGPGPIPLEHHGSCGPRRQVPGRDQPSRMPIVVVHLPARSTRREHGVCSRAGGVFRSPPRRDGPRGCRDTGASVSAGVVVTPRAAGGAPQSIMAAPSFWPVCSKSAVSIFRTPSKAADCSGSAATTSLSCSWTVSPAWTRTISSPLVLR